MHAKGSDPAQQAQCEERALHWLVNMQSGDGGWAAFDVDNNWAILNKVPFADHNAMLDPTCPDITGRVLEALCRRKYGPAQGAVRQGVQYLLRTQERDGGWWGRWGVNYVYGTFLALRGMRASGDGRVVDSMTKAARWIAAVQNPDGGWGETCASYVTEQFAPGLSTPSQTAWGSLALLASGDRGSAALKKAALYLIETQRDDGEWDESLATGTGFPKVFYLRYRLYRNYFPVLALREAQRALAG
jgi:squalene-hopene/tetraprenyl-beta-curcumene cyclase